MKGKVTTRPMSLAPPLPSQDVSRYQAVNPPPATIVEVEARRPWLWVVVLAALIGAITLAALEAI